MKRFIIVIGIICVTLIGCQHKDCCSSPSMILTLGSSNVNGKITGFSFASGQIIYYPNTNNLKPDFSVYVQQNDTGVTIGPYLAQQDIRRNFYFAKYISIYDSAKLYFDTYKLNKDTVFGETALSLKQGQIWIIRTNSNSFGKILIFETTSNDNENKPYAEIKFLWGNI